MIRMMKMRIRPLTFIRLQGIDKREAKADVSVSRTSDGFQETYGSSLAKFLEDPEAHFRWIRNRH